MAKRKDNDRMGDFVGKVNGSSPKKTYGFSPPPEDIKKHEEKTSLFDTLKNTASTIMSYHPVVAAAKVGTEFVKTQIAENLRPQGYHSPVKRVIESMYKAEPGSANFKRSHEKPSMEERQDALSLMMTGKQKQNKLPVSEYSPEGNPFFKNLKKDTTYYKSPETEKYIRSKMESLFNRKEMNKDGKLRLGQGGSVLGKFTIYKGKDEKGEYIDYYDKWDLNPFQRKSDVLDKAATVAQNLAGVKPAEFYGRVYRKEGVKTLKQLKQQAPPPSK